jgi:hypothetical protein
MNLSQFVALTCRQLSPFAARSDAHSGSDEGNEAIFRQTSSLKHSLRPRPQTRMLREICATVA